MSPADRSREQVSPADLRLCGELARKALSQLSADEWDAVPPRMDWTRRHTMFHTCGALQFYATQLAVGSPEFAPTVRLDASKMEAKYLPMLVQNQAVLLGRVAAGTPEKTRGYHGSGSPDAEGYLAMGCTEVLLHTWDCINGTSVEINPDEQLVDRVIKRLFPWAPADPPRWQTLLWATGRGELEGFESPGNTWMWHPALLSEWDGK